ncbi:MAG TPA: hypothetical protein EYG68_02515 [Leucothrix mucor]|nr:hypothetical protein [Leucothrix mucor]
MPLRNNFVLTTLFVSFALMNHQAMANPQGIYRVNNVGPNGVLNLRETPSVNSKVLLELPRNARWISLRLNNNARGRSRSAWQKVSWNNHEGWVDSSYLVLDPEATKVKLERVSCLQSNPKLPVCCGYPKQKFTGKLYPVKVYSVRKVDSGSSLNVRKGAGRNMDVVETMPHNAVGIVKLPIKAVKNGTSTWEKVRWNGQNGWVNSYYLKYDPELSASREHLREICNS